MYDTWVCGAAVSAPLRPTAIPYRLGLGLLVLFSGGWSDYNVAWFDDLDSSDLQHLDIHGIRRNFMLRGACARTVSKVSRKNQKSGLEDRADEGMDLKCKVLKLTI